MGFKDPQKQKDYQREWLKKRRAQIEPPPQPCPKCGKKARLRLSRVGDPAITKNLFGLCKEKQKAALKHFEWICIKCHSAKPFLKRNPHHPHATREHYERGCLCRLCRAAYQKSLDRDDPYRHLARQRFGFIDKLLKQIFPFSLYYQTKPGDRYDREMIIRDRIGLTTYVITNDLMVTHNSAAKEGMQHASTKRALPPPSEKDRERKRGGQKEIPSPAHPGGRGLKAKARKAAHFKK